MPGADESKGLHAGREEDTGGGLEERAAQLQAEAREFFRHARALCAQVLSRHELRARL